MSAFFLVEYAGVTLGLAEADFSGLITVGFGREGIDGGSSCFGDFGGGTQVGPAGVQALGRLVAMVAAIYLRYVWVK